MTHRKSFPLTTRMPLGSVSFHVESYLVTFLNFSKLINLLITCSFLKFM
jgi:hypothetical protein